MDSDEEVAVFASETVVSSDDEVLHSNGVRAEATVVEASAGAVVSSDEELIS